MGRDIPTLLAGPGTDQVQRPLGPTAVEGAAQGLAIDRHDFPVEGLGKRLGPGADQGGGPCARPRSKERRSVLPSIATAYRSKASAND